ncbi:MAG: InlB B-repeat-containing protein [Oscillospiraceae bacterium]|nr:InlB B-repeat-containing protein [Oscillospiraceae bacterium]
MILLSNFNIFAVTAEEERPVSGVEESGETLEAGSTDDANDADDAEETSDADEGDDLGEEEGPENLSQVEAEESGTDDNDALPEAAEEQAEDGGLSAIMDAIAGVSEDNACLPFSVQIDDGIENGTLSYAISQAETEDGASDVWMITVKALPDDGYTLAEDSVGYTDNEDEAYNEIAADSDGAYSFRYVLETDDVDVLDAEQEQSVIVLTASFVSAASWYTDGTYILNTAADLQDFADMVNDGTSFSGKTVQLGADISLDGIEWVPIGGISSYFQGTFEGNDYTISDLSIPSSSAEDITALGLFGVMGAQATVQNVTVEGEIYANMSQNIRIGGIAGYSLGGSFSNVTSNVSIYITVAKATTRYIGGIVGDITGGSVSDAENNGGITLQTTGLAANTYVQMMGGIVGRAQSTAISDCISNAPIQSSYTSPSYAGGILGQALTGTSLMRCGNNGDITITTGGSSSAQSATGGLVGHAVTVVLNVEYCYNRGDIAANIAGYPFAGGLVGYISSSSTAKIYFTNCYSLGAATASSGGLAGSAVGYPLQAYNYFTNCYTAGTVGQTFTGNTANGVYTNTFYLASADSDVVSYGAQARTLDTMGSRAFTATLGNAFIYAEGRTPMLYWERSIDSDAEVAYLNYNESSFYDFGLETRQDSDTVITVVLSELSELPTPYYNENYYKFVGWFDNPDGTGLAYTISDVSNGDTLYAIWDLKDITVTFYDGTMSDNELVPYETVVVGYSQTVSEADIPQKEGYTFKAWVTDGIDGSTLYNFSASVTQDISIYASWEVLTISANDFRWYTDDPDADSFVIGNAAQLKALMYLVNGTAPTETEVDGPVSFEGKTITLSGDIDLSGISWSALIGARASTPFKGTFSGKEYELAGTNVAISSFTSNDLGLFGYTAGARFEDLVISYTFAASTSAKTVGSLVANAEDTVFSGITVSTSFALGSAGTSAAYNRLGGLVGAASGCTFDSVIVSAATALSGAFSYSYIGGIAGSAENSTFTGCINNGTVNGGATYNYVGGLIGCAVASADDLSLMDTCKNYGAISGTVAGVAVGGLVGYLNPITSGTVTISASGNYANLTSLATATGYSFGGIVGLCLPAAANKPTVVYSDCTNEGVLSGKAYMGGIVGTSGSSSYPVTAQFVGCENNGSFGTDATSYLGGIAGYCYGVSDNRASFESCINNAAVPGTTYHGGISGYVYYTDFTGCENTGAISGTSYLGGLSGYAYYSNVTGYTNTVNISGSTTYQGGIFGYGSYTVLTNCVNEGDILVGTNYVGGIIGGGASGISLVGCENSGDIKGTYYVGGILGNATGSASITDTKNAGTVSGTYHLGGIVGNVVRGTTLSICENSGAVTSTATATGGVGGIVGTGTGVTLTGNMNTAVVTSQFQYTGGLVGNGTNTAIISSSNSGNVSGTTYVGGLVGNGANTTITSSSNSGSVSGTSYIGGVTGRLTSGSITWCNNNGSISTGDYLGGLAGYVGDTSTVYITKSYNTGSVSCGARYSNAAGLVGFSNACYVADCYNTGDLTADNASALAGGLVADGNYCYMINCYQGGNMTVETGASAAAAYGGSNGYIVNCYYLPSLITTDVTDNLNVTSTENMSMDELAYLLDGGSSTRSKCWTYTPENANPTLETGKEVYKIAVTQSGSGTLLMEADGTAVSAYVRAGDNAVLTATPDAGNVLGSLSLANAAGELIYSVKSTSANSTVYRFVVAGGNLTLNVAFIAGDSSAYQVEVVDGGDAAITITEEKDEDGTVTSYTIELETPVRDGYTFDGWYLDAECTVPFVAGMTFTEAQTLYAKWIKNDDGDDGTTDDAGVPQVGDNNADISGSANYYIDASGTYTLGASTTGKIYVVTEEPVKIVGDPDGNAALIIYLSGNNTVILSDLHLTGLSSIDVSGQNNTLYLEGENTIIAGAISPVHVPSGSVVTFEEYSEGGILYAQNSTAQYAAIGGNATTIDCGQITINSGTVIARHGGQGAAIGTGGGNVSAMQADSIITVNGGMLVAGYNGGSYPILARAFVVNGGTVLVHSWSTNTLISVSDNLEINGGSIKTIIRDDANQTNTEYQVLLNASDAKVSGNQVNAQGSAVYPAVLSLWDAPDGTTWQVAVDSVLFYSGPGHTAYVKNPSGNGTSTLSGDMYLDYTKDADLYLYLPGNYHVLTAMHADVTQTYLATRENTASQFTIQSVFTASFEGEHFGVVESAGVQNGIISGDEFSFILTADDGYVIKDVTASNGNLVRDGTNYTVTDVTGDVIITVTAARILTATFAGEHFGVTEGAGLQGGIIDGDSFSFTLTFDTGYVLKGVTASHGSLVSDGTGYTVTNVTDDVVITVTTEAETPVIDEGLGDDGTGGSKATGSSLQTSTGIGTGTGTGSDDGTGSGTGTGNDDGTDSGTGTGSDGGGQQSAATSGGQDDRTATTTTATTQSQSVSTQTNEGTRLTLAAVAEQELLQEDNTQEASALEKLEQGGGEQSNDLEQEEPATVSELVRTPLQVIQDNPLIIVLIVVVIVVILAASLLFNYRRKKRSA